MEPARRLAHSRCARTGVHHWDHVRLAHSSGAPVWRARLARPPRLTLPAQLCSRPASPGIAAHLQAHPGRPTRADPPVLARDARGECSRAAELRPSPRHTHVMVCDHLRSSHHLSLPRREAAGSRAQLYARDHRVGVRRGDVIAPSRRTTRPSSLSSAAKPPHWNRDLTACDTPLRRRLRQ